MVNTLSYCSYTTGFGAITSSSGVCKNMWNLKHQAPF